MGRSFFKVAVAWLLVASGAAGVHANQGLIVRDGSMGAGQDLPVGSDPIDPSISYLIEADMGEARGENLFHSFSRFGVGAGEVANFTAASSFARIIARITGSESSLVEGTIRSSLPGADFFLLNPNGVIFTASGTLDVRGSVAVSTADQLQFSDGNFQVTDEAAPWSNGACCTGAPIAYGFTGASPALAGEPAEIVLGMRTSSNGFINIPMGEEASAVGGRITLDRGRIALAGGALLLAATGHAAVDVPIDLDPAGGWYAALGPEAAVRLIRGYIYTSNPSNLPSGDGRIVLRGGRLELDLAQVSAGGPLGGGVDARFSGDITLANGSWIHDRSSGPQAQGIWLEGESLSLDGAAEIVATAGDISIHTQGAIRVENTSEIKTTTALPNSGAPVDAGNVNLTAGSLTILSGGQVSSLTGHGVPEGSDPRAAGDVDITVAGEVRIAGSSLSSGEVARSGILARALAGASSEASGGDISVTAGSVDMADGALVSASSDGGASAGSVTITSEGSLRLVGGVVAAGEELTEIASRGVGGQAGNVRVEAASIEVLDGAAISASSQGAGNAGSVTVVADHLRVSGRSTQGAGGPVSQASAIYAEAPLDSSVPGGSAGDLVVTLQHGLEVSEGGVLSVRTRGSGAAGAARIRVEQGSINLSSGGRVRSESTAPHAGAGAAGSLNLYASGDIRVSDGARLEATAQVVDAGDIRLEAGGELTLVDGLVNTRSGTALGGNIWLDAGSFVDLVRSGVATDVGGAGDGGNIFLGQGSENILGPPRFAVLNASRLTATAQEGQGGYIFIAAGEYLESAGSEVDASSGDPEKDGIVELNAPELEVSGNLEVLPSSYLDVSVVLQEHCAARRDQEGSSLTVESRPNIAPEPGGFLVASVLPPAQPGAGTAREAPARVPAAPLLPLTAQLAAFDPGCGG